MDPANVDRRRGLLVGISDASLTVRSMVIAGVTGKIEQKNIVYDVTRREHSIN